MLSSTFTITHLQGMQLIDTQFLWEWDLTFTHPLSQVTSCERNPVFFEGKLWDCSYHQAPSGGDWLAWTANEPTSVLFVTLSVCYGNPLNWSLLQFVFLLVDVLLTFIPTVNRYLISPRPELRWGASVTVWFSNDSCLRTSVITMLSMNKWCVTRIARNH